MQRVIEPSVIAGLRRNLIAYWPLDEGSSVTAKGYGPHGAFDFAVAGTAGSRVGPTGNLRLARESDGTINTNHVALADRVALRHNTTFTYCGWVLIDTNSARRVFASKWNATGNNREMIIEYFNTPDRFALSVTTGGDSGSIVQVVDAVLGAPSTATWYFMATGWDRKSLWMSINGGAQTRSGLLSTPFAGTATMTLVGALDLGLGLDGAIAGWARWNRTLSEREYRALYNNGAGFDMARWLS